MSRLITYAAILAIALSIFLTDRAFAQGCQHCGCEAPCRKVCRLVREEAKVEVTCWGCKVEDFCLPGPSKPGCKHHDVVCGSCGEGHDPKAPISQPKKFVWTEWIPGCATVHTRSRLMKRTVTQTIPSYKWVVEDLCNECESKLPPVPVEADADVPPPPRVEAATRFHPARTPRTK